MNVLSDCMYVHHMPILLPTEVRRGPQISCGFIKNAWKPDLPGKL